jgi:hypothetical protein
MVYRMQAAFAGVQHAERDLTTHEERMRREAQEKPLREDLERITQRLAAIKQSAWPLAENHRAEIAKRYRQPVDPRGNEENFAPISARFVRMTILATYQNQEPALDELEVWTHGKPPINVALASRGARASARSRRTDGKGAAFYKLDFLNDGTFDEIWISDERGTGPSHARVSQDGNHVQNHLVSRPSRCQPGPLCQPGPPEVRL